MFLSWQIYDFFENGGYIIFLGFMSEIALWLVYDRTTEPPKRTEPKQVSVRFGSVR